MKQAKGIPASIEHEEELRFTGTVSN